jgi:hypothetical protein
VGAHGSFGFRTVTVDAHENGRRRAASREANAAPSFAAL